MDENDLQTIQQVSEMMCEMANKVLAAPEGWSIKVGEPDVIKNGDIWCADNEQSVEQFKELLNYTE